jgi:hypothetical protein
VLSAAAIVGLVALWVLSARDVFRSVRDMGSLAFRDSIGNPFVLLLMTLLLSVGIVGFMLLLQGLAAWLTCPPASASPLPRRAMLSGLLYAIPLWVLGGYLLFNDQDKWDYARPLANGIHPLANQAMRYYVGQHADATGTPFTHRFPPPADWTPPDRACDYFRHRYPPRPELWERSTWRALGLAVTKPSRGQYKLEVPNERTAIIRVRADQDCDGDYANWSATITVTGDGVLMKWETPPVSGGGTLE